MQDRLPPDRRKPLATRGRTIHLGQSRHFDRAQRSHIYSCKRFAAFLKRSPDTATAEDIRLFQLHLAETGMSICNRNRIMTGVRFCSA
jgi:hypothetical protein